MENKINELYIKLISINNILRELNQDDLMFTNEEWDLIKKLIKG